MILAHHGFGEEILLGSLAAGGTTAATGLLLIGRAKIDAARRWLSRRFTTQSAQDTTGR